MSDDLLRFVLDAKSVGDLDFVVKSIDQLNQAMGRVTKVTSTANEAGALLSVSIERQTEDYKKLTQVLQANVETGKLEYKVTKDMLDLLRQEREEIRTRARAWREAATEDRQRLRDMLSAERQARTERRDLWRDASAEERQRILEMARAERQANADRRAIWRETAAEERQRQREQLQAERQTRAERRALWKDASVEERQRILELARAERQANADRRASWRDASSDHRRQLVEQTRAEREARAERRSQWRDASADERRQILETVRAERQALAERRRQWREASAELRQFIQVQQQQARLQQQQAQAAIRFGQQQQAVGLLRARANQMPQVPIQNAGAGGAGGGGTPWWMPAGMGPGGGGAGAFLNASSVFGMPGMAVGGAVAAAGALMVKAANDAIPFHRQIAEIRTISQEAQLATNDWAEGIFRLSNAFGRSKEEVAEGVYQLLSNQVAKGADAFKILNSAMGLAQVTQASTADSVNALSSAMNSYNFSMEDSERVSAVFFKAVDLGRFRLADLSNNIGRVTFTGAQLGVSLEESLAALTVMTRRGLSSAEAMTLLHNLMIQLIKPSEEMRKTFREWGVETGQQAIAAFGFTGVLQRIGDAAKDNTTAMAKMFPEIRAMRGAFGLASDGAKEIEADLRKLENAARDYKVAQDEVFNAPGQQIERWKAQVSNAIAEVGSNVLRFYEGMFRTIRNLTTDGDKDSLLPGSPEAMRQEELDKRHDSGIGASWEAFLYLVDERNKKLERLRYEEANKEGLALQRRQRQAQATLNFEADQFEERARLFNEFSAKVMADQEKLNDVEKDVMEAKRTDMRASITSEIQNLSTTLREERSDRLEALRNEQNDEREVRREMRREEVQALKDHHAEVEEEIKRSRARRDEEFKSASRNLEFNRDLFGIKKEVLDFATGGKATFGQSQALRTEAMRASILNAKAASKAGDLSSFRSATGDIDKLLIDEISARKDMPNQRAAVMELFRQRIALKQQELQVEQDIQRRMNAEKEADRTRDKSHKAELIAMEVAARQVEREERQREREERIRERQEERDFAKFERSVSSEIKKQEQALLGLDPSKFGSTSEALGAFNVRAAAIVEKSGLLHPGSAAIIEGVIDSYREVFALEAERHFLEQERNAALDHFNKLVKDGSEAMRKGGSANVQALEEQRLKIVELNNELMVTNALLRGASPEDAFKLRGSAGPAPTVNAPPNAAQRTQEAVDTFRAAQGIPDDVSNTDVRKMRSQAMRNGADFYPQALPLNAARRGASSVGGDVVNIGDINVVVPGGSNPEETGRNVGQAVRREVRRGTLRLPGRR